VESNLFLGWLVNGLVTLGGLVVVYRKLSGQAEKREIAPQPLQVEATPSLITRGDCERQHKAEERFMASRFSALEGRIIDLTTSLERRNAEGEMRASGIHKRVDAVASDLAAVKGTLTEHIAHGRHGND
jgi:hypothetical protein